MNGRHRGAAQGPGRTALWGSRYATGAILLVTVPLGVMALLAWLVVLATPREQWAASGLILLGGAIVTLARGRGRGSSRWSAAGQVLIAASLFMHAAVSQLKVPQAYAVTEGSILVIGAACLCASIALIIRSGSLGLRWPSWLSRGPSAPG